MTAIGGRTIGNYRVEDLLGRGSRAEVYRASHVKSGRAVALKVLNAAQADDPVVRARFLQAARAVAALHHPHLVPIYDIGEQEERAYLAMELLAGGSLRDLLDADGDPHTRPVQFGLEIVRQAAEGVAHGHRHRMVHCDLRPSNLLLAPAGGQVKVGDFGLAGLLIGGVMTAADLAFASPAYLSPEQCLGGTLDGRTDIYALGVILYELMTGKLPFLVQSFTDALHKHANVPPSPPGLLRPDLPGSVEAIILRCLAKSPAARYSTAHDLATALGAVIAELGALPIAGRASAASAEARSAEGEPLSLTFDETTTQKVETITQKIDPALALALTAPAAAPAPPGTTAATPPAPLELVLDDGMDQLVLAPGKPVAVRVFLRNRGESVVRADIRLEGLAAGWVQGGERTIELPPGRRTSVILAIAVEATPLNVAGEYPVKIAAWSHEEGRELGAAVAHWTVLPFAAGALEIDPPEVVATGAALYRVTVRNWGNTPLRRTLRATDSGNVVDVQLERDQVDLDPTGVATVGLLVQARPRWFGQTRRYNFEVVATSADLPPLAAVGCYTQRPRVPNWGAPALLMALLGLVVAVALVLGRGLPSQAGTTPTVAVPVAQAPTATVLELPLATTGATVAAVPNVPDATATTAPTPATSAPPVSPSASPTPEASEVGVFDISATSLTFGSQRIATFGAQQSLRIANTGAAPLTLGERRLTGASEDYWVLEDRCPARLGGGESCTIALAFKPTVAGVRTATLIILLSDGQAKTVTLSGSGVVTLPGTPAIAPPAQAPPALAAARADHAATLLADGRTLLVAGGRNGPNQLKTVELYNVVANGWRGTQDMTTPRADHTASTLPDGRVLVLGGHNGTGTLKSAELYDPETETWSQFPELRGEREGHTATLYADPQTRRLRLIVLGGRNRGGVLATAEIYDFATGAWTDAGKLPSERTGQTATLLPDQRHILVVGGTTATDAIAPPALLDLVTGAWASAPPLPVSRRAFAATLLPNGRVLLTGGVAAGAASGTDLATTLLYDPAGGAKAWSEGPPLARGRAGHTASLLPYGRVLIVGGQIAGKESTATELYNPNVAASIPRGALSRPEWPADLEAIRPRAD